MTPAAAPAPPRAPAAAPDRRARVAAYLRDLRADPGEVWDAVQALDAADLQPYGTQACHLNLVSLFGGRWPAERVRAAAQECARMRLWRGWSYYAGARALSEGRARGDEPVLAGWDRAPFDALRSQGRGVLVAGFHLGSYRHIPTDLAHLGLPVTFAVDTRTLEQDLWGAEDFARLEGQFRLTRIDDPASLVTVVRALRGGGVAYLNVDANRGWGVGHGDASHAEVGFLGIALRVMTGAARLAAANRAAVVPVAALPDGRHPGRVVIGPPVLPPEPGADAERWAGRAMQSLYDFFAPYVQADPAEWQDVRFLHRWRAPAAPALVDAEASRRAVYAHLAAGGTWRLDEGRALPLAGGAELVDARTLRSFRAPADGVPLVRALQQGGVDAAWLGAHAPGIHREGALALLAALHGAELIAPSAGPEGL